MSWELCYHQEYNNVYLCSRLRANPTKSKVSLFHLRNSECGKHLNISWNNVKLTLCNLPVYLSVTLDRKLSHKAHIEKTKQSRNKKLYHHPQTKKLEMGSHPNHTQVVSSSYSAIDYVCPVCERSTHAKKLNGHCMKPVE